MKAKIFAKLKQENSDLGLGDEILMSRAEMLASTGLVTDDNIDAIVAYQRKELQELQKANDKRVTDALEKERRKQEEESKRKAEAEKKAAEEKAAAEKAQKEAEEKTKAEAEKRKAEEKAKEEAEKKAKEELEAKRKEFEENDKVSDSIKAILAEERKASEQRQKAYEEYIAQLEAERKKEQESYLEQFRQLQESHAQLQESNKTMTESYNQLKLENDAAKAEKAKADRQNFILSKAKELGVPQWRIDEGFVIAEDADNEAIETKLTQVANNLKTAQLPSAKSTFPINDGKPSKDEIKDLASHLVK